MFEIYKNYTLLHRHELKTFARLDNIFAKISTIIHNHLPNLMKFTNIWLTFGQLYNFQKQARERNKFSTFHKLDYFIYT